MDRRRLPLYDAPAYRGGPAGAVGTWPLDVDRFTALYLGAPPPVTLPDGWTLLAAFPGRVRPGVELHARHPDWGDHVVDGERRSSLSGEAEVREAVARGRREGCAQVTFTGREPTLDPRLDAYVRLARDLG